MALPRLGDVLRILLPSFLVELILRDRGGGGASRSNASKRLHATAYLDGLRGLACLAVFGYHYTDYNHKYFHPGWGTEEHGGSSVLQLPFVRLIHEGRPMVHTFFVISGFALSLRPLRELHAGRIEGCHSALASASFRRPIRLMGPCLILTFSLIFCSRMGLFSHYIKHQDTLWRQVTDWADDWFGKVSWAWDWEHGVRPRYNVHLWTIAVELSHSYLLFFVLLALSRLKSHLRPAGVAMVMAYGLMCGRWAVFDFFGGCLLADLHLWEQKHDEWETSPRDMLRHSLGRSSEAVYRVLRLSGTLTTHLTLIVALYIMSWPSSEPFPAPYVYLLARVPRPYADSKGWEGKADFWVALSSFAAVWAIGRMAWARKALELPFPQYMGRISFAFYILQHPVLNMLQAWIMGASPQAAHDDVPATPGWGLRGWPGVETWTQRVVSWLIGWVVLGLVEGSIADVYTRLVDQPCIKLARWAEEQFCVEREASLPQRSITKVLNGERIG